MSCHDAREQFSALIDNALDAGERAALDAHLATCADCRRELQRFRDTVGLVRAAAPVHAPAGSSTACSRRRDRCPGLGVSCATSFCPGRLKLPMEAAAIVLVAVGVALVYRGRPSSSNRSGRSRPARDDPSASRHSAEVKASAPHVRTKTRGSCTVPEEEGREARHTREPEKAKRHREHRSAYRSSRRGPGPSLATLIFRRRRRVRTVRRRSSASSKRPRLERAAAGGQGQRPVRDHSTDRAARRLAQGSAAGERAADRAAPSVTSAFVPPDLSGQLAVSDRELALSSLKELAARSAPSRPAGSIRPTGRSSSSPSLVRRTRSSTVGSRDSVAGGRARASTLPRHDPRRRANHG